MPAVDRHLDLGCGKFPRNPYHRTELCGVDIRPLQAEGFEYRLANLAVEPIPYFDDSFGSVSAYDFIEHVPRLLPAPDGRSTIFPFVRLMDEIWRVLQPGGRLYALTPAYPHTQAFVDPTHVNIITECTHAYFCGEHPLAGMYGFTGRFKALRCEWVHFADVESTSHDLLEDLPQHVRRSRLKRLSRQARRFSRWLRGKSDPSTVKAHLLWELEAIKPTR
ncbi:MAG TPA: methyltransferase domain-containing protein [Rhodanobacteraceae bacterium]